MSTKYTPSPVKIGPTTTISPINSTQYAPLTGAGVASPRNVVVATPNTSNILAGTPRYAGLASVNTPRIGSGLNIETVPNLSTPHPELLTNKLVEVDAIRSDVQPTNPVEVYLADSKLEDNIVENELLRCGYTIINKIIVNDGGIRQCSYIRCTNKLGQMLLVELNVPGVVLESNKDLTIVRTVTGSSRNYSLRVSEAECAKLSGCNVGFVCTDGICILENDDNGDIVEQNYEFVKEFARREVVIDDAVVAVPIVHLSDIRANNNLVLQRVNEMTKSLRKRAFELATRQLNETRNKIDRAGKEFNKYMSVLDSKKKLLMRTINEFERYSIDYERLRCKCKEGILPQVQLEKHKEVVTNLVLRSEKVGEMLKSIRVVNNLHRQLDNVNLELAAATKFLCTEFEHVGEAYIM